MSDQYRDSCIQRQDENRGTEDPIRVSFYDKDGTQVTDITRKEAKCISNLNPTQLFYFEDGNGNVRELNYVGVSSLSILDAFPDAPECPTNPLPCGPPKVQFFGGNGLGAAANAIISPNSSSVIGFDIVNPGFNFLSTPLAELVDECGTGSGGKLLVQTQPFGTSQRNNIGSGRTTDNLEKVLETIGKTTLNFNSNGKGGLEVKNIVVLSPGDGYLARPDGSKGGNGRTVIPARDPNDLTTPPLPNVTFTASKYLLNSPEEITLFWSTENTTTVNITEVGNNLALTGSQATLVNSTKTYILTAFGPGGNTTSRVTISLLPSLPPEPPIPNVQNPPSVIFVSSKYTVNYDEEFELQWTTINTTSVEIDQGIGFVNKNGKITLTIGETTTFTLTAIGSGGLITQKLTVFYNSPIVTPPVPPTPVQPQPPIPPIPVQPQPPTPLTPPSLVQPQLPTVQEPLGGVTYKVLMCLDEIYIEDGGFGFVPGDIARVVPENGSQVEMVINQNGEIQEIKVLSKGCGYTDIPEIVIETQTGYNAKLYPVLSATRIIDEQLLLEIPPQVELISVVDCVGIVPPKKEFDRVPR